MSQTDFALRYDIQGNYARGFNAIQSNSQKTYAMLNKQTAGFENMTSQLSNTFNALSDSIVNTNDITQTYAKSVDYLGDEFKDLLQDALSIGSVFNKDLGRALKVLNKTNATTTLGFLGIKKILDKSYPSIDKYLDRYEKLLKKYSFMKKAIKFVKDGFESINKLMQKQTLKIVEKVTAKWDRFLDSLTSGGAIKEVLKIDDAIAGVNKSIRLNVKEEEMLKNISTDVVKTLGTNREAIISNLGTLVKSGVTAEKTLKQISLITEKIGIAADNVDTKDLSLFLANMKKTAELDDSQLVSLASGMFNIAQSSSAAYQAMLDAAPLMEKVMVKIPKENRLQAFGAISTMIAEAKNQFADPGPILEFFAKFNDVSAEGVRTMGHFGAALTQLGTGSGPEVVSTIREIQKTGDFTSKSVTKLFKAFYPFTEQMQSTSIEGMKARLQIHKLADIFGYADEEMIKLVRGIGGNTEAFEALNAEWTKGIASTSKLDAQIARQNATLERLQTQIANVGDAVTEDFYRPFKALRDQILIPVEEKILSLLKWMQELSPEIKQVGLTVSVLLGLGIGSWLVKLATWSIGASVALGGLNMAFKYLPGASKLGAKGLESLGIGFDVIEGKTSLSRIAIKKWFDEVVKAKGAKAVIWGWRKAIEGANFGLGFTGAIFDKDSIAGKKVGGWLANLSSTIESNKKNPLDDVAKTWVTNFNDKKLSIGLKGKFKKVASYIGNTLGTPLKAGGKKLLNVTKSLGNAVIKTTEVSGMIVTDLVRHSYAKTALSFRNVNTSIKKAFTPILQYGGKVIEKSKAIGTAFMNLGHWSLAFAKEIPYLGTALTAAGNAMSGLGIAFKAALGPIGIAVLAIGALWAIVEYGPESISKTIVAGTKWLADFSAKIPGYIEEIVDFIPSIITKGIDWIIAFIPQIPTLLSGGLKKSSGTLGDQFLGYVQTILSNSLQSIWHFVLAWPKFLTKLFMSVIGGALKLAWMGISALFSTSFWKTIFGGMLTIGGWLVEGFSAIGIEVGKALLFQLEFVWAKIRVGFANVWSDMKKELLVLKLDWAAFFGTAEDTRLITEEIDKNERDKKKNANILNDLYKKWPEYDDRRLKTNKNLTAQVTAQQKAEDEMQKDSDTRTRNAKLLARYDRNLIADLKKLGIAERNSARQQIIQLGKQVGSIANASSVQSTSTPSVTSSPITVSPVAMPAEMAQIYQQSEWQKSVIESLQNQEEYLKELVDFEKDKNNRNRGPRPNPTSAQTKVTAGNRLGTAQKGSGHDVSVIPTSSYSSSSLQGKAFQKQGIGASLPINGSGGH